MAGRGRPGVEPQVEKRREFAQLISAGFSVSEAARQVDVNRKTGVRWCHGRTITTPRGVVHHYPSVLAAASEPDVSARYLSEDERTRIADLTTRGAGVREIARDIGRSPSTVSRELRRNTDRSDGSYRPFAAQRLATTRRARPGRGRIANDEVLRRFVCEKLKKRWSPTQISHALREVFVDEPERHLVAETIYQACYRPELGGLARELPRALCTGRRRRRPRRRPDERRPQKLISMTMIAQRPAEAADRSVPGHWEGDLVTGRSNRSAIGTLVERRSRFTILLHLPGRHTAEAVCDALIAALGSLPPCQRRSLTWDQGSELALHAEIACALGMPIFFCDAHSPWQRPTNENTNGLLREYFPKSTDLHVYSPDDLRSVAAELNDRPRQVLGWRTPAEVLAELTTN